MSWPWRVGAPGSVNIDGISGSQGSQISGLTATQAKALVEQLGG